MIKIGDKFRCVSSPQKSIEAGDIVEVQSIYEGYDKYYCYYVKNLTNGTAVPSRTYLDKSYEPFKYKAGDKYLGSLNDLKPLTLGEAEKLTKGQLIVNVEEGCSTAKVGEIVNFMYMKNGWIHHINKFDDDNGNPSRYFAKLPEEENNMSELEELVKIANAGLNAFVEIEKSHKESITWGEGTGINWSDGTTMGLILLAAGHNKGIRIKPEKPKFEEFTTKEGWLVKILDSGLLQIGCRKDYKVEEVKNAFDFLINKNNCNTHNKYFACKAGVKHDTEILNWDDAERILKQLREMQTNEIKDRMKKHCGIPF